MTPYSLMCMCCHTRKDDWYSNGVKMQTFLENFRFLFLCFAMLATNKNCEKTGEACVDLQLTSGSGDNVVQVNEEGDAHINFVLSDNCTGSNSQAVVKLSVYETGRAIDLCTIVLRNNTCTGSDRTFDHRCINTGYNRCSVSWKVKTADKLLMLRLTNIITKEEKVILFNIAGPASKKIGTPEIIGICCGITVAAVSAAVVIRKWKFGAITVNNVYIFTSNVAYLKMLE